MSPQIPVGKSLSAHTALPLLLSPIRQRFHTSAHPAARPPLHHFEYHPENIAILQPAENRIDTVLASINKNSAGAIHSLGSGGIPVLDLLFCSVTLR
jgi:hypothetical protein